MSKEQTVDRLGFLERVASRRQELRLSEQRVCREAGLSTSAIKNLRQREDQLPTLKLVVPIAQVLGVNREWLAFGTGDKYPMADEPVVIPIEDEEKNSSSSQQTSAFSNAYAGEIGQAGIVPELDARAGAGDGSVGAVVQLHGGGISSGHAVTHQWGIPPELMRYYFGVTPGRVIILPVKGDSMHPTLSDGDRILIDLDDVIPNDGGIFLLDDGHGPIVKRARLLNDNDRPILEIISDNTYLSPIRRPADEVRVLGRVRGKWSRI